MYAGTSLFGSSLNDLLHPVCSAATVCSCVVCDTGSYSDILINRSGRESVSDSISLSPSLIMHLFRATHFFRYGTMPVTFASWKTRIPCNNCCKCYGDRGVHNWKLISF